MEKTIVFKHFGKWCATRESNYNAVIMNDSKVAKLHGAFTENDAVDALVKWGHIKRESIIIKY